jgi:hypothetical protein
MKDEDAFRIANSLERIATGLDRLNELLQRQGQTAKRRVPNWAWTVGVIGAALLIYSVVRT